VDDFIVNIYQIPANSEYDGKFQFRPANEIIPDHGELAVLPQFDLANEMNVCYSVESRLMSNGLADELAKPIALKQVYLPTNPVCSDNQNVQFDSWDYPPLTIIISKSPMAAYPEFPMFKEEPYEVVESLNTYKIYVRPVSITRTDSHLCIYGSFKIGDLYVFTRTGYMSGLSEQNKLDLVENMDQISRLLENRGS
jgi:hypothetical protein